MSQNSSLLRDCKETVPGRRQRKAWDKLSLSLLPTNREKRLATACMRVFPHLIGWRGASHAHRGMLQCDFPHLPTWEIGGRLGDWEIGGFHPKSLCLQQQ
jgi:hypothetical protein